MLNISTSPSSNATESIGFASTSTAPPPAYQTWLPIATFLIMQAIGTGLYFLIFVAIYRNRKVLDSPFYTYLVNAGLNDITLWLPFYGAFGCVCIAAGACPVSLEANVLICAFSWIGWFFEVFIDPMIAIDRLVAVCFYQNYEAIFRRPRPVMIVAVIWMLAIVTASPTFFMNLVPSAYDVAILSNYFIYTNDASNTYNVAINGISFFNIGFCTLLYLICVAYLFWRRHKVGTGGAATSASHRAQRNLLIQGVLRFISLLVYDIFFLLVPNTTNFWVFYVMIVLVQAIAVNTPIVTILLNSAIREAVANLIGFRGGSGSGSNAHHTAVVTVRATLGARVEPINAIEA